MPTYTYEACAPEAGCAHCRDGFDVVQTMHEAPLPHCPVCGSTLRKCPSRVAIGRSQSSLDHRAKAAGFTKLKKIGRGEYEKHY